MRVQSISGSITRYSLAAAAAAVCMLNNSCYIKDERYHINHNPEPETEYIEKNPLKIFNKFAEDIGLLNQQNGIEKAGAVEVESRDGTKVYCIYDKLSNTNNQDTLTIKQVTFRPDSTVNADTFLMYFNLGKLQIENKSKTIKNVSLQKDTYKTWKEFRNDSLSAEWYKIADGSFARDTGKRAAIYNNITITTPPEGY